MVTRLNKAANTGLLIIGFNSCNKEIHNIYSELTKFHFFSYGKPFRVQKLEVFSHYIR